MTITVNDVRELIEDEIQTVNNASTQTVLRRILGRIDEVDVFEQELSDIVKRLNEDDLNRQFELFDKNIELFKRVED